MYPGSGVAMAAEPDAGGAISPGHIWDTLSGGCVPRGPSGGKMVVTIMNWVPPRRRLSKP